MSDDRTLDVLYVSPERFRASPQVGVGCRMSWTELAGYLSRPSIGEAIIFTNPLVLPIEIALP